MHNKLRAFALVTFALILNTGCTQPEPLPHQLFGRWLWLESDGGFIGEHRTPESVGYNITIRFTVDSKFEVYHNGALTRSDNYTLKLQDPHKGLQSGDTLQIANDSILRMVEFEGEDILVLKDYCMDCFVSRFIRGYID